MRTRGERKASVDVRAYRAFGWALVLFLATGIFYLVDRVPGVRHADTPQAVPVTPSASQPDPQEVLRGYPAPSMFRAVAIDGRGRLTPAEIPISGECAGGYYALVVFPNGTDYRSDPARAALNRATPCVPGERFSFVISSSTAPSLPAGDYYIILADQGPSGLWYNPR